MHKRSSTTRKAFRKLCEYGNLIRRKLRRVTSHKIIAWIKALKAVIEFIRWLYSVM